MTVKELIVALSRYPEDMIVYSNEIRKNFKGELVLQHKNTKEEDEYLEKLRRESQEELDRSGEITSFANRW